MGSTIIAPVAALVINLHLSYSYKRFGKAKDTCLDWRRFMNFSYLEAQYNWGLTKKLLQPWALPTEVKGLKDSP